MREGEGGGIGDRALCGGWAMPLPVISNIASAQSI